MAVSLELPAREAEDGRPAFPGGRVAAPTPAGLPPTLPGGQALEPGGLTADGGLTRCLACGHPELYSQKDFPRALGIAIVVVAALLAPATSYLSLVGAALFDSVLYSVARDKVVCYVCGTNHRGFLSRPRHPRFDREIDERLRYGEKAVMGKPMRPGGTADAPEPEH